MEGQSVTRLMNKQIITTLWGFVFLTDNHLLKVGRNFWGSQEDTFPFHFVSEKVKVLVPRLCLTLCDPMNELQPAKLLCLWNSPGKNTGVGSHLQGIILTQRSNPGLLHCR